jgi:type II secretory pathway pseudopilin PulG
VNDRQTYLIEEQKMNEGRISHVADMMMAIVKFYFVTVFSVVTIMAALYNYKILEDISRLVVYVLLLPLLVFGFCVFFSLKKLLFEYNYWLSVRNQIGSEMLRGEVGEFYPYFEHPLNPFVSLIRIILTGNTLGFLVLAVPGLRGLSGWGWLIPITLSVTFVIGLLATLSVVALNSARQKSRDSKRVADIKQIQTALELYFADYGHYPVYGTTTEPFVINGTQMLVTGGIVPRGPRTAESVVYMGVLPANPQPGGIDYTYVGSGESYSLDFELEGSVGDIPKGKHKANPHGII